MPQIMQGDCRCAPGSLIGSIPFYIVRRALRCKVWGSGGQYPLSRRVRSRGTDEWCGAGAAVTRSITPAGPMAGWDNGPQEECNALVQGEGRSAGAWLRHGTPSKEHGPAGFVACRPAAFSIPGTMRLALSGGGANLRPRADAVRRGRAKNSCGRHRLGYNHLLGSRNRCLGNLSPGERSLSCLQRPGGPYQRDAPPCPSALPVPGSCRYWPAG